jgi:hypothetical protein
MPSSRFSVHWPLCLTVVTRVQIPLYIRIACTPEWSSISLLSSLHLQLPFWEQNRDKNLFLKPTSSEVYCPQFVVEFPTFYGTPRFRTEIRDFSTVFMKVHTQLYPEGERCTVFLYFTFLTKVFSSPL